MFFEAACEIVRPFQQPSTREPKPMFEAFRGTIIWTEGNVYRPISEDTALRVARALCVERRQRTGEARITYELIIDELEAALFEASQWRQRNGSEPHDHNRIGGPK